MARAIEEPTCSDDTRTITHLFFCSCTGTPPTVFRVHTASIRAAGVGSWSIVGQFNHCLHLDNISHSQHAYPLTPSQPLIAQIHISSVRAYGEASAVHAYILDVFYTGSFSCVSLSSFLINTFFFFFNHTHPLTLSRSPHFLDDGSVSS
jgi:hypothetical protein